jgi:predicted permease
MTMLLKLVLRRLRSSPLFTAITVITLAIGIGANTGIFTVVNAVLLRPLPYPQPNDLVYAGHMAPALTKKNTDIGAAPFLYFTYREQGRTFDDIGMWQSDAVSLTGRGEPERLDAIDMTDGLLRLLLVRPEAGRLFSRQDDLPASRLTLMLSYGFWQGRYGGDRSVIGRDVILDGRAHEIIGILPRDFWFFDRQFALALPLQLNRSKVTLGGFGYQAIARLKPGVTIDQAAADLKRMIPIGVESFPSNPGSNSKSMFQNVQLMPRLLPLKEEAVGEIRRVLWTLMGTIGAVLLIASANVANLMLVRADARQHEFAIRAALGGGRSQIAAELLTESIALALIGGALGSAIAYSGLRLLVWIAPANLPRLHSISIDGPALLFTLGLSVLTGVVFGLVPAIKHAVPHLAPTLGAGGRSMSLGKEGRGTRNSLAVVQVALAVVLLVGSGLMIRTFYALNHVPPGFEHPETLQAARIVIPAEQIKDGLKTARLQHEILDKISSIPGVESAAMLSAVPMSGGGWHDPILSSDQDEAANGLPGIRFFKFVSPGLFKTMGTPLLAGRDFSWADLYDKHPVAIVSENVAREMWHSSQAAIAKRIRTGKTEDWREVIGVVGDDRSDGLSVKPSPTVYWPVLMDKFSNVDDFIYRPLSFVVRSTRAGTRALTDDIQRSVWSVNPDLPVANVHTLAWYVDRSMARTSFALVMLGISGTMALLLSLIGVYGVIAYAVSKRAREIGIRMALGASMRTVTRMFIAQALLLAAIGVAFGLAAATVLTAVMGSLLFGVRPIDPLTDLAVSGGLVAATALASYLPALRAAGIDPAEALRCE